MIKLENTQVVGWEPTIRGMRNPKNSWEKSDSLFDIHQDYGDYSYLGHDINGGIAKTNYPERGIEIGSADKDLMMRLARTGSVDAKYRRMLVVYVDITAPLYWWKEFDTYKVGTVANSCSTMHKIHAKPFEMDDFSHEHLYNLNNNDAGDALYLMDFEGKLRNYRVDGEDLLGLTINVLNYYRRRFLETKDKGYWWQMIQLLPTSYNQRRTVMLNYEVLAGIYPMRKNHKLDEWHTFCDWIKGLPYSEIIIGDKETVTWQQILKDFEKRYPEYFKHFVDYRPTDKPFIIQIWLDVANAVTGNDTITYDYTTKRISL